MKKQIQNLSVVLLVLCGISGCSKSVVQPELVRPAQVFEVGAPAPVYDYAVYSGDIHARREADLSFLVGGKLLSRSVELGTSVKPGQELAKLDASDLQWEMAQAQAQLAGVAADAENADSELARAKILVAQHFISAAALDTRQTAAITAHARLNAVRAQAGVAANQLRYSTLRADAAGVVTGVDAEAGQVVSVGQPVVRVAYDGNKEVQIYVAENATSQVKVGEPAQVRLWAFPSECFAARVREIAPSADQRRTFLVKIALDDSEPAVKLGMSASVVLTGHSASPVRVVLPSGALLQHGNQTAVWQVDPRHQVRLLSVKVVQYRENYILVAGNLTPGTLIIAAGAYKFHEGQMIIPAPYDGAPMAGADE